MNKNIIYVVEVFKDKPSWAKYTKSSIKKYAKRCNADVEFIGADYFKKVRFPDSFNQYTKIVFLKLVIMHEFIKTKYQKGLILDIDILVSNKAKNIFQEKNKKDFYMEIDGFPPALKSAEWKVKNWVGFKNFKIKTRQELKDDEIITDALPNAGVILFNKHAAQKIYKRVPPPLLWKTFFTKRYGKNKNFLDIYDRQITEQELILFLSKEFNECAPYKLGAEWNGGPYEGVFFIHLYKHKDFLKFLSKNYLKRTFDIIKIFLKNDIDI